MGFFGLLFWLAVAWLVFRAARRWGFCAGAGRRGSGQVSGWYDSGEFYARENPPSELTRRETASDRQDYIDALETRVSDLEERLDFTERLLANREPASGEGQPAAGSNL